MSRTFLGVVGLGLAALAGAQTVSEPVVLTTDSAPQCITPGPDGNLWFSERGGSKIGKILLAADGTPNPTPVEYPASGSNGSLTLRMQCVTPGPDGNMWFTVAEAGNGQVGKISLDGTVTLVSGVLNARAYGITAGPDGNLWFVESVNNVVRIGRMTPGGHLDEFDGTAIGNFFSVTNGITAGPDGAIWFTEEGADRIGRIPTSGGAPVEYPVPAGSGPAGITTGPDGALWFAENKSNKIGRMTTNGTLTNEYTIPTAGSGPQGITVGPDGNLWFTESANAGNQIGRITTSGHVTEFGGLTGNSQAFGITATRESIWFTELSGNKLGRLVTGSSGPPPTPTPTPSPTPSPTPGNGPNLQISKTDDGRYWIDSQGTVNYTIAYSNTGSAPAHGVRLIEHPDPQENFFGGGGFDSSGVLEIGDLAAGASGTVSLSIGVALNPDDPESQPYDVHNEVEITGSATAQVSSAGAAAHTAEKLVPGPLDGFAAEITAACAYDACSCPLVQLLEAVKTHFKRTATLVQAAARDILLYYRVRDRVLAQSPGGKRYIALYYHHASEMRGLLAGDDSLRSLALTAMDAWGPGLEALVEGQGGGSTVTQAMADSMTALLEKLKQEGSAGLRSDIQQEQAALNLPSLVGQPMDQASRKVDQRPCVASDGNLCLNNGRFRVDVAWRVPEQAKSGVGTAKALTGDTGYFWFFNSANVELVIKVLDAAGVNHHFWVFYGALSDVAYTITVTDTQTGVVRTYSNPDHNLASFADTSAFTSSESSPALEERSESRVTAEDVEKLSATELHALYGALTQTQAVTSEKGAAAPCATGGPKLCLGGRFEVTVDWSVPSQGRSGTGTAIPVTGDTGYMWFFSDANVELIIKVLDGRSITGHYWVFYGALSDVQYTITVKDTQTGAVKTYENPSGHQASNADTSAF